MRHPAVGLVALLFAASAVFSPSAISATGDAGGDSLVVQGLYEAGGTPAVSGGGEPVVPGAIFGVPVETQDEEPSVAPRGNDSLAVQAGSGAGETPAVPGGASALAVQTGTATGAASPVPASNSFPVPPTGHDLKKRPETSRIFQLDESPIGDRSPLLLIHGGNGENQKLFRWDKLVAHFQHDPAFMKQFKIYFLRYDSGELLEKTVPQSQDVILELYDSVGRKPINILALSMGGNVIQWALTDPKVDHAVNSVLAMATPFHGSPLFSADWFQYSLYKSKFLPGFRLLDSLDYRVYFSRHKNYQKDLKWDNADKAIPQVGAFRSKVPLGPKGVLDPKDDSNNALALINSIDSLNKRKFVTYAAYMLNSFVKEHHHSRPISVLKSPLKAIATQLPAQLGREQAALKVLNREISKVKADEQAVDDAGSTHLFALNDGITPLCSALFMPPAALQNHPLVHETDIPGAHKYLDVKKARVFRGFDHVAFVDGEPPHKGSDGVRDELHPEHGTKHIFDWISSELMEIAASPAPAASASASGDIRPLSSNPL